MACPIEIGIADRSMGISGGGGFNHQLMSSTPFVALVCLSWGVRCNPHRSQKMSKILNFLVNTSVFKARNAPKPVFGRDSAPDPSGVAYDPPPDPIVVCGGGHPSPCPSSRCLRHLASDLPSSLRLIPTLGDRSSHCTIQWITQ